MDHSDRAEKKEKKAFMAEIIALWPLAKGSIAEVRKPCIRPECKACRSGVKHRAYIFSFTEAGRRRCMYVPRELVTSLRQAIQNGRRLEERLVQAGKELIHGYRLRRTPRTRPPDVPP